MARWSIHGAGCALDSHPDVALIEARLREGVIYRDIQEEFLRRDPPDPRVTPTRLSQHRLHAQIPRDGAAPVRSGSSTEVESGTTTLEDMRATLRDLVAGRIAPSQAFEILQRDGRPLYRRPEFRELRERRIEGACAQCGEREGPLVLQHLRQPPAFRYTVRNARGEAFRAWQETHPRPDFSALPQIETSVCPACGLKSFYRRATMKVPYRCTQFGHEFTEPGVRSDPDPEMAGALWNNYLGEFEAECRESYEREATIAVLRGCIAYLEGANVTTLCKKCAYMADVNGMVLCSVCGEHWHSAMYASCYACNQMRDAGHVVLSRSEMGR